MEFDPQANGGGFFVTKFIRVGEAIHTGDPTAPDFNSTSHGDVAKSDNISPEIEALRVNAPVEVDAGLVLFGPGPSFDNPEIEGSIIFTSNSSGLHIPVRGFEKEAREKTVRTTQILFPKFNVKGDPAR